MINNELKIGNLKVGKNHPPLIVPEIGINHNGNLNVAIKMVDAAKKSGAKIIKHQKKLGYFNDGIFKVGKQTSKIDELKTIFYNGLDDLVN